MGDFAVVVDGFRAPAGNLVNEILDSSRDFATAIHEGADTLTDFMVELFFLSFRITGALVKIGTVFLFFAFVGFGGYEFLRYSNFLLNALAVVLMVAGFVPIVGGLILGEIALLERLFGHQTEQLRRPKHPDDWIMFCLLDALAVAFVLGCHGLGVTFYSPLLSSVQNLVTSL